MKNFNRVAKIAYYNSKISSGSSSGVSNNAFKANIFTNGMRGNFFSQERLPLRSCKIKMKLKKQPHRQQKKAEKETGSFLTCVNDLSSVRSIDRNTTLTVQSTKLNVGEELTDSEIRLFFKSLLVYVPISNVMRLNDLLKANECELREGAEDLSGSLKLIHELILGKC